MSDRPYVNIVGELAADFIALVAEVSRQRPEIAAFPGSWVCTIDEAAGTVSLGKLQAKGLRVIVVEAVRCDPHDAATFGQSVLPIIVPDGADKH